MVLLSKSVTAYSQQMFVDQLYVKWHIWESILMTCRIKKKDFVTCWKEVFCEPVSTGLSLETHCPVDADDMLVIARHNFLLDYQMWTFHCFAVAIVLFAQVSKLTSDSVLSNAARQICWERNLTPCVFSLVYMLACVCVCAHVCVRQNMPISEITYRKLWVYVIIHVWLAGQQYSYPCLASKL